MRLLMFNSIFIAVVAVTLGTVTGNPGVMMTIWGAFFLGLVSGTKPSPPPKAASEPSET